MIWAHENTRDALFEGMQNRETYATSGTRIQLRLFAGSEFPEDMVGQPLAQAYGYAIGVPMGGIVEEAAERMQLYVAASRDPFSAPLQRLQIVKGWLEDGQTREAVVDIACSEGLEPVNGRCPDNGAQVNLADCSFSEDVGATQLATLWEDPDFDPEQRAFYYARVLENPTCRWSTWDALRLGVAPREDVPAVIQERAWS